MKILFLDIDGVVNCSKTVAGGQQFLPIDPFMALLVNRICEATGAQIVLSSSWRLAEESRAEVNKHIYPKFIDVTPYKHGLESRGSEIKAWLKDRPGVARYAILDDNSDMLKEQMPNFFKTEWDTGLTEEIAKRVIEHLNSYPLLGDAPDHFSEDFIVYLRKHNPVVFEDDDWIVIENCKYHTPERMWLTAFAKRPLDQTRFTVLHDKFGALEWLKKAADSQTVKRFHVHFYERGRANG